MLRVNLKSGRCLGRHNLLLIEEYNSMGAVVSCLVCGNTFQIGDDALSDYYMPFNYLSGTEGPRGDITIAVLASIIPNDKK